MVKITLYFLAALLLLPGCASLHSVSITQIPVDREQQIEAEVHSWVVLGLIFDNDFVDSMRDKLRSQCPNGKVTGILTKYETYTYFLFWKRSIKATAFCVPGSRA